MPNEKRRPIFPNALHHAGAMMLLTTRMFALVLTLALATGGTAWSLHSLMASAEGSGSDYGLDTDGDGTFEWLVVEAHVDLPEAGTWDVSADLSTFEPPASGSCHADFIRHAQPMLEPRDRYGPIAWVYERYFFPAGPQTVRMAFPGSDISRAGVDGPYAVHAVLSLGPNPYLRMERPVPGPMDGLFLEWTYTTQAYAVAAFEAPARPASFTGPHGDSPVDVDGDGSWDLLELTAGVHVNVTGRYSLHGTLSTGTGGDVVRPVAYGYRDVTLGRDDTEIYLRFRGDQIHGSGVDGPWDFALTLFGPIDGPFLEGSLRPVDGEILYGPYPIPETLCGTTAAYRASDFDETVELLRYTGRFDEAAPDFDRDGLADALVVAAEVDVLLTAGFDVAGTLRSADGSREIAWMRSQVWLAEGVGRVEFSFAGPDIRSSGVDGPYEATLSLTPTEWGIDPTTTYVTRAYRAADFDDEAGHIRGYWIESLTAESSGEGLRIVVDVVRGHDLLTVVIEDGLEVTVTDASGTVVGTFRDRVSLPSGGSRQTLAFSAVSLAPGAYTITAVLGSPDQPVDVRSIVVAI